MKRENLEKFGGTGSENHYATLLYRERRNRCVADERRRYIYKARPGEVAEWSKTETRAVGDF